MESTYNSYGSKVYATIYKVDLTLLFNHLPVDEVSMWSGCGQKSVTIM